MESRTCQGFNRILHLEPLSNFYRDSGKYRKYDRFCKTCRAAYQKWLRSNRKSPNFQPKTKTKVCSRCKRRKSAKIFFPNRFDRSGLDTYCMRCRKNRTNETRELNRDVINKRNKLWRDKLQMEVMQAYGNKCACCGLGDVRFLTLDHVNNDGAKHRKEIGGDGATMYRWCKNNDYPNNIQLLCFNCNGAKQRFKGICPHKLEK